MVKPDLKKFKELSRVGNLIPVYREILADMDTPLSVLMKLSPNGKNTFLMESVERSEHIGRYSFIGTDPRVIVKLKDNKVVVTEKDKEYSVDVEGSPFRELKKILKKYKPVVIPQLPRFCGGAVGFMGYEVAGYFEEIPQSNFDDLKLDDAYFLVTDTIVVFDHAKNKILVISNAHLVDGENPEVAYSRALKNIDLIIEKLSANVSVLPCELTDNIETKKFDSNMTKQEFKNSVEKAKEYIRAGDIFQVVLSQRFCSKTTASPINLYRALRSINPSPYMYYLYLDDYQIIGSSPEIMVRCEDGVAEIRPIAGTRKRGKTQEKDTALEKELLSDPKEIAEHVMLVDLGRNDIGRVCNFNTVYLPEDEFMIIERYSHVMHIVSDVKGRLKDDCDVFDVIAASFPAGTVSGAPKIRAMEIIDELENRKRGPYAGAVGYFSFDGNLDTAITIRTIILKNGNIYIQAGAGIVADSDPDLEYKETINKANALLNAVALAERLET